MIPKVSGGLWIKFSKKNMKIWSENEKWMVFTKATGLLIKMYFSKFSTLGFKLQLFLRYRRFFLQKFSQVDIFCNNLIFWIFSSKKFFLPKHALTAKYLKAENLPVIVFEKFKISDFLQNQNIIFDGSNLLTVKKPLLVEELEDLLMIYKNFIETLI